MNGKRIFIRVVRCVLVLAGFLAATTAPLPLWSQGDDPPAATYLGGASEENAWDVVLHPSGDVVFVGWSWSTDLLLEDGSFHESPGTPDAFVARVDPSLENLVSMTILGGMGDDRAFCADITEDGTVVVGGLTTSPDFPVTGNAFDRTHDGFTRDAFVVLVDVDPEVPQEDRIRYATFLGDTGEDACVALAVGSDGLITAVGYTNSTAFPTVPGAFQPNFQGGAFDTFIVQLLPDQDLDPEDQLIYATYFGGTEADSHPSNFYNRILDQNVALDPSGAVVMVGLTNSSDLPTTDGAYSTLHKGGRDAYVMKLLPDPKLLPEEQLLYGTFLAGGAQNEGANSLAINERGDIYLAGWTWNSSFPTTAGAYDRTKDGNDDAFLSILRPDLDLPAQEQLRYSTFFGGSAVDYAQALVLGGNGRVYLVGGTKGTVPQTPDAQRGIRTGNWEGFLAAFDIDPDSGSGDLVYSSYVGGGDSGDDDTCYGLVLGEGGAVFIASTTTACDLPVSPDAAQESCGGGLDAALWRRNLSLPTACFAATPDPLSGPVPFLAQLDAGCSPAIVSHTWDFGDGSPTSEGGTVDHSYEDPGRYQLVLGVTNAAGHSARAGATVTATCAGGDVAPWTAVDVGEPLFPGASWQEKDAIVLCAGGQGLTSAGEELHFLHQVRDGDFVLTARLADITGGNIYGGGGLVVRSDLTAGSPCLQIFGTKRQLEDPSPRLRMSCRYRSPDDGSLDTETLDGVNDFGDSPLWLRVERHGTTVSVYTSRSPEATFAATPDYENEFPGTVLVGLAAHGRDLGTLQDPFSPIRVRFEEVELAEPGPPPQSFRRGDANDDGNADLSDAVFVLAYLFLGGPEPTCLDTADIDDSASVGSGDGIDISDPIFLLNHLFLGGTAPPPPYPGCGDDPTTDDVSCAAQGFCP